MTQPSSGLRRRPLAAFVAALLCATVLAAGAAPAHAANTASEVLVDTDNDGDADDREFGGSDRYDTALRLAKNFAAGKGGSGQVPVAFVASGVTLVDAVSVSGLAGFRDAPVLLTPETPCTQAWPPSLRTMASAPSTSWVVQVPLLIRCSKTWQR